MAPMRRATPRRRRGIAPWQVRWIRLLGFRYSHTRQAYVLRLVGRRHGPVFRVRTVYAPEESAPLNTAHRIDHPD